MWRHGPQNDPKRSKNHLKRQISQLNDCVGLRMCKGEFFGWKTDCGVRILTFWLFEGVNMMLECYQMIELSWKFAWIHIFARGTRWWCQNYNILTYWRLWLYIATSNMTSDIIRQSKSPFKCYNVIFDITARLTQ